MTRIRERTKKRLDRIAKRNRWTGTETLDAATDALEAVEKHAPRGIVRIVEERRENEPATAT